MIRILLACGVGASTGFMAKNMRKVAKKKDLDAKIFAVSKSEVMDYADSIDVLLLGPHYKAEEITIREKMQPYNVKVECIKPEYYSMMDGESILNQALNLFNSK